MAPPASGPSSWTAARVSTPILSTKRKRDTVMTDDSPSKRPRLRAWLSSKPFIFVVGSEMKEYYLHKELLAKLSEPLRALVYGGMQESIEGKVEWPDVDEETFVRFSEFVYDGEYTDADAISTEARAGTGPTPGAKERISSDLSANQSASAECTSPGLRGFSLAGYLEVLRDRHLPTTIRRKTRRYEEAIRRFFDTRCGGPRATMEFPDPSTQAYRSSEPWAPSSFRDKRECFVPIFACHYKLYILADKYIIPGLMAMAHNRLCYTLFHLKLHHAGVLLDLKALVEMVWQGPSCQPIMDMILAYCACIAEEFQHRSEFHALFRKYPEFAIGLLDWTCKRLQRAAQIPGEPLDPQTGR